MKQYIVLSCLLIQSTISFAQDWSRVPAFPAACYSTQDNYLQQLDQLQNHLKNEMEAENNKLQQKAAGMSEQQKMQLAMQYQQMSPAEIVKMQEEQQELMTAMSRLQEETEKIDASFRQLEKEYQEALDKELGPLLSEMRKLPDGEGTPDWAIKRHQELSAEQKQRYEKICAYYFSSENALFKKHLAAYRKHLLENELPVRKKQFAMSLKQFKMTAPDQQSEKEVLNMYLERCKLIYQKRRWDPSSL